jgi:hypothetical protein
MSTSKEAATLVVITFLSVVLIFNHSFSALALPRNTNPIFCHVISNSASASHPNGITECCQGVGTHETFGSWCTKCDNTNPPSNCGPRYCVGNCDPYSIGPVGNSKSTPPAPPNALQSPSQQQQTTKTCPNGLAPDANGNCPPPTTTTNNQQLAPPSSKSTEQHHNKGSNLLGGQGLTTKKGSNNDNSPTPPPCPTDNSPIPPNCTLKPNF